jgi:hypothetical protein
MASGLPKWVSELLDKGEKLEVCLELLKNMQATEREDRAAEREMRKIRSKSFGLSSGQCHIKLY